MTVSSNDTVNRSVLLDDVTLISEAELLKMPANKYMSAPQLKFFHQMLQSQLNELIEEIEEARDRLNNPIQNIGDDADQASKFEMQQLDIRIIERKTKLARKIESALRRIESGNYGYCIETREPIGLGRLLARPTATLSINSKEHAEFHEQTVGTSELGKEDDTPPVQ